MEHRVLLVLYLVSFMSSRWLSLTCTYSEIRCNRVLSLGSGKGMHIIFNCISNLKRYMIHTYGHVHAYFFQLCKLQLRLYTYVHRIAIH